MGGDANLADWDPSHGVFAFICVSVTRGLLWKVRCLLLAPTLTPAASQALEPALPQPRNRDSIKVVWSCEHPLIVSSSFRIVAFTFSARLISVSETSIGYGQFVTKFVAEDIA